MYLIKAKNKEEYLQKVDWSGLVAIPYYGKKETALRFKSKYEAVLVAERFNDLEVVVDTKGE